MKDDIKKKRADRREQEQMLASLKKFGCLVSTNLDKFISKLLNK